MQLLQEYASIFSGRGGGRYETNPFPIPNKITRVAIKVPRVSIPQVEGRSCCSIRIHCSYDSGRTWEVAGGMKTNGGPLRGIQKGAPIPTHAMLRCGLRKTGPNRLIKVETLQDVAFSAGCSIEVDEVPIRNLRTPRASIALEDSVAWAEAVSATSVETGSVTPAGTDRALYAWGMNFESGAVAAADGCDYDTSTAMTEVGAADNGTGQVALFRLIAPDTGGGTVTYNIDATNTYIAAMAFALSGVDQTTPDAGSFADTSFVPNGTANAVDVPADAGDWAIGMCAHTSTVGITEGDTLIQELEEYDSFGVGSISAAYIGPSSGATENVNWTYANNGSQFSMAAGIAVNIAATAALEGDVSDGLSIGDTVDAIVTAVASVAEVADLNDTPAGQATALAAVAEAVDLDDTPAFLRTVPGAVVEALQLTDTAAAAAATVAAVTEAMDMADTDGGLAAAIASLTDGMALADAVAAAAAALGSIAEALELADTVAGATAAGSETGAASEDMELAELVTALANAYASLTEATALSDAVTGAATALASVAEALEIAETLERVATFPAATTEALELSELISSLAIAQAAVSETVAFNDATAAGAAALASIAFSLTLSDTVTGAINYVEPPSIKMAKGSVVDAAGRTVAIRSTIDKRGTIS